jgi:hypothetical protein
MSSLEPSLTFLHRRNEKCVIDDTLDEDMLLTLQSIHVGEQTIPTGRQSPECVRRNEQKGFDSSSLHFRPFGLGLVLDNHCPSDWITETVEDIRLRLPLDSKRPTVSRRFYHDIDGVIVHELERLVYGALVGSSILTVHEPASASNTRGIFEKIACSSGTETYLRIYCNPYVRILEYDTVGCGLAPHTDGTKVCDTTRYKSTHTLLLYLSDCKKGGETAIMLKDHDSWSKCSQVIVPLDRVYKLSGDGLGIHHRNTIDVTYGCTSSNVCLGVSPIVGRIFLFPHEWPHAGAICENVPKIMLRAEMTIQYAFVREDT